MLQASIHSVFQIIKRRAAKNEQGFITPTNISIYAPNAEKRLFHDILYEYRKYLGNKRRYLNYEKNNYDSLESIKDDLRFLQRDRVSLTFSTTFQVPDDYAYYIDVQYKDTSVEIIDISHRSRYKNAFDAPPSESCPVGIIGNNGIEIMPDTINSDVYLSYYKTPQGIDVSTGNPTDSEPVLNTNTVDGQPVYDPDGSVDFEFPKHLEHKLAYLIMEDAGLELRESDLIAVAQQERQYNDQRE